MPHRDELQAALARVAALEQEVRALRARLGEAPSQPRLVHVPAAPGCIAAGASLVAPGAIQEVSPVLERNESVEDLLLLDEGPFAGAPAALVRTGSRVFLQSLAGRALGEHLGESQAWVQRGDLLVLQGGRLIKGLRLPGLTPIWTARFDDDPEQLLVAGSGSGDALVLVWTDTHELCWLDGATGAIVGRSRSSQPLAPSQTVHAIRGEERVLLFAGMPQMAQIGVLDPVRSRLRWQSFHVDDADGTSNILEVRRHQGVLWLQWGEGMVQVEPARRGYRTGPVKVGLDHVLLPGGELLAVRNGSALGSVIHTGVRPEGLFHRTRWVTGWRGQGAALAGEVVAVVAQDQSGRHLGVHGFVGPSFEHAWSTVLGRQRVTFGGERPGSAVRPLCGAGEIFLLQTRSEDEAQTELRGIDARTGEVLWVHRAGNARLLRLDAGAICLLDREKLSIASPQALQAAGKES